MKLRSIDLNFRAVENRMLRKELLDIMLFSEMKRIFKCDNISISERLNTVEASFCIEFQNLPIMEELQYIFSIVPTRDTLELTLKSDSGDIIQITNSQVENCDISKLTNGLSFDDEIDVSIRIDKDDLDNIFSIYDFDSFSNDLIQRATIEVMKWFSDRLRDKDFLRFEVFDYDISFATRTLAFESSGDAIFSPKVNRLQRLRNCKENACFYNMNTYEMIPDDFIFEGIMRAGDSLKSLFGKLATILSLIYVVSSSSIDDDGINLQINGQRTINQMIALNNIEEDEKWISIYNWIFTDGNPTDKMLITHNVMSLYCKYESFLSINETMFDAIKTNYNLYLRTNASQYLDMKREIGKFIQNIVAQISDYALSILGKFKANLIAIFVFLFTVVLTDIGTVQNWEDIFTKHTIYIIELFAMGSMVYMVICIFETIYKLKKVRIGYEELRGNYKDVLSDLEINEAFQDDRLFDDANKSAKSGLIGWSIAWGILLLLCVLIIEIFTTNHGLLVWLWNKIF